MRILYIVLVMLVALQNVQSQTFTGNEKDIAIILENTKAFSQYVMASDFESIGNSYTADAKIFPNNKKILEGPAILAYWTLPEGISIPYHKITQSEITIVNDTAYDYGYYEGKTKNKDGQIVSWKGKYVIVWKKIADTWKMHLDIWNGVK